MGIRALRHSLHCGGGKHALSLVEGRWGRVIPAKAGIQSLGISWMPGFHRHDDKKTNDFLNELLRLDAGG
jgi:hypothetical protein